MHEWITTSLLGIECNFNNMSPIMNEMMPTMLLPGANTARRRTFHATRPHDTTTKTGQNGKHRCSVPENSLRKSRVSTKCEEEFDDLNLPWLFDPDRNDHLPLEEQLAMYAERDLLRGKLFNIGARLWPNDRRSRKRVFNVGGGSYSRSAPVIGDAHAVLSTGPLRPYKPHTIEPDAKELRKQAELAKRQEQKDWVEQRKRFRAQLDGLGLSEDYLRRKPNKTLMELRVLREMVAVRTAQPPSLPVSLVPVRSPQHFVFFALFPIWGRHIKLSFFTFSGKLFFVSLYSFMSFRITLLSLKLGLLIFRGPIMSVFSSLRGSSFLFL